MKRHLVCLAMTMIFVLLFSQLASATAPLVLLKSKSVKNSGRADIVLPAAVELDDQELATVEGEGLLAGLVGAVAGAVSGAISYTAGYLWDTYVDDALETWFGDGGTDDDDPVWEWSSFYDAAGKAAIGGFFSGLIMP